VKRESEILSNESKSIIYQRFTKSSLSKLKDMSTSSLMPMIKDEHGSK
jgi:hypothetical protein